jgi:hypothetical protein
VFEPTAFRDLVRALGREAVLRKVVAGEYDPATDTTTDTTADTTIDAAFQTSTSEWVNGTLVRVDGNTCLIPAYGLAVVPEANDRIIDGAVAWRILSIRDHKPGGARIGWFCRIGG